MEKQKLPIRLLKQRKVKGDKVYNNLYLQFAEGSPIAIDLVRWNPKVKNLLLANAYDFEVATSLKVATDEKAAEGK